MPAKAVGRTNACKREGFTPTPLCSTIQGNGPARNKSQLHIALLKAARMERADIAILKKALAQ
jgi:hypothetical protein